MNAVVRRAAVAGSWYPGSASALSAEVDSYLEAASAAPPPGRLVGLVSPHAGLHYSGPVAAYGYGLLRGLQGDLSVVLVGPSHRAAFKGVAVHARGVGDAARPRPDRRRNRTGAPRRRPRGFRRAGRAP
jgi:AmmeMemoRadiSam system protein B